MLCCGNYAHAVWHDRNRVPACLQCKQIRLQHGYGLMGVNTDEPLLTHSCVAEKCCFVCSEGSSGDQATSECEASFAAQGEDAQHQARPGRRLLPEDIPPCGHLEAPLGCWLPPILGVNNQGSDHIYLWARSRSLCGKWRCSTQESVLPLRLLALQDEAAAARQHLQPSSSQSGCSDLKGRRSPACSNICSQPSY